MPGHRPKSFYANVHFGPACHEWMGYKNADGYGKYRIPGVKTVSAHRHSYEVHNGPIPSGMLVLHKCDNPACVRWDHLFLGTDADNSKDKCAKSRQAFGGRLGEHKRKNTHCPSGHEYSPDNTRIEIIHHRYGDYPARRCLECKRIQNKRSQAKQRIAA